MTARWTNVYPVRDPYAPTAVDRGEVVTCRRGAKPPHALSTGWWITYCLLIVAAFVLLT